MPFGSSSEVAVAATSSRSCLSAAFLALVDPLQVADQLRGHAAASLAGSIARADLRQQRLRLSGGQVALGSAGEQLEQ
jgi:hypothetical protein